MAKTLYFSGETELKSFISPMSNKEFAERFPGVKGRRYDGYSMMVGEPVDFVSVWQAVDPTTGRPGYSHDYRPVDRVINYKSSPSLHECDARCMNASGRTMNCECSCGGKNHGRGFRAEAA